MIVLTLMQPWATLAIKVFPGFPLPPKGWETRSWKPGHENAEKMRQEGFLIHASKKPANRVIRCSWPFMRFIKPDEPLPQGAIIGHVRLGRLLTTHDWMRHVHGNGGFPETNDRLEEERQLGDYSAGRYAWEMKLAREFKAPIPAKGALALWQYDEPINLPEQ